MNDPRDDIPFRAQLLYAGVKLTSDDRNKQYGEPVKNMQDIARLWSEYLSIKFDWMDMPPLTGEDVAHLLSIMKIARTFSGVAWPDNYVDSATYQAIAGECAEQEKPTNAD